MLTQEKRTRRKKFPVPGSSHSFVDYLTVGNGLLGQVIVEDHGVLAVVAEVLSDRRTGVGRKELVDVHV